jgi:hypothetical protein
MRSLQSAGPFQYPIKICASFDTFGTAAKRNSAASSLANIAEAGACELIVTFGVRFILQVVANRTQYFITLLDRL